MHLKRGQPLGHRIVQLAGDATALLFAGGQDLDVGVAQGFLHVADLGDVGGQYDAADGLASRPPDRAGPDHPGGLVGVDQLAGDLLALLPGQLHGRALARGPAPDFLHGGAPKLVLRLAGEGHRGVIGPLEPGIVAEVQQRLGDALQKCGLLRRQLPAGAVRIHSRANQRDGQQEAHDP